MNTNIKGDFQIYIGVPLNISQYSQESCKPATLLKRIFKNTYFEEHLPTAASDLLIQLTEHQWAAASVLTYLLSSGNLLTGYEQLSY